MDVKIHAIMQIAEVQVLFNPEVQHDGSPKTHFIEEDVVIGEVYIDTIY
jgi:hypothetical protein